MDGFEWDLPVAKRWSCCTSNLLKVRLLRKGNRGHVAGIDAKCARSCLIHKQTCEQQSLFGWPFFLKKNRDLWVSKARHVVLSCLCSICESVKRYLQPVCSHSLAWESVGWTRFKCILPKKWGVTDWPKVTVQRSQKKENHSRAGFRQLSLVPWPLLEDHQHSWPV